MNDLNVDAARGFAVIPAAGHSSRMGRPKLLLPYRNTTVIEHVLHNWIGSRVARVVVVVRRNDAELARRCEAAGADLVQPENDPQEMKASVAVALEHLERQFRPRPTDAWLLAPADMPRLSTALINRVLAEYAKGEPSIAAPTHGGKRGHPVAFPWAFASEVSSLPADRGVNALLSGRSVRQFDWHSPQEWQDLDTPEQFLELQNE